MARKPPVLQLVPARVATFAPRPAVPAHLSDLMQQIEQLAALRPAALTTIRRYVSEMLKPRGVR